LASAPPGSTSDRSADGEQTERRDHGTEEAYTADDQHEDLGQHGNRIAAQLQAAGEIGPALKREFAALKKNGTIKRLANKYDLPLKAFGLK